ncbi:hypothetical protein SAMN05421788_10841 [Filimonas lacunae]|uniref:Immunity protein 22 n=1 Tax=Filimonas lacunae TaxID=477680 RepID=A0A173MEF5_9BACT|nr:hypothetical protein [Filimonas lacunae]BAV05818.1 hypothetical protein FLA_1830 [Filimonas lacunae]SIT28502.1 hypothetical protein SAMN05421788_10841 [Filimonas lacunae]
MEYQLKVNQGIAPFYLGESIDSYLETYDCECVEEDDDEDCEIYVFFHSEIKVNVNTTTRLIEGVQCGRYCYMEKEDVIGMNIHRFLERKWLEGEYIVETMYMDEDDKIDNLYDFDCGVMIWVNQLDTIETVFVC